MKRWKWILLIFELVLFAAILVLPQVDLPDFTFHGGTAPITAKQRISIESNPAMVSVGMTVPAVNPDLPEMAIGTLGTSILPFRSSLSLFCILIC